MDPFFTSKPGNEGTGLGLSVTHTIAAAHGGELAFEFPNGVARWQPCGSGLLKYARLKELPRR